MLRRIVVLGILLNCCASFAHADTISVSCSQSAIQAAINAVAAGDTVVVTGGGCGGNLTLSKPITLSGGGNTTLTGIVTLTTSASGTVRVTGFTFTGSGANARAMYVGISSSAQPFRIDHNTFQSNAQAIYIEISGLGPGLIDHNSLTSGAAAEMIHNSGLGPDNASGWTDSVQPGGPGMVFVEDNTFTYVSPNGNFNATSALQSHYGARTVVRHNTFNLSQIDQHGGPGLIGARWWEIYENTFNTNVPNANQCCFMVLRAGSGVVFNNHHIGSNISNGTIQLIEEDSGYPALYQVGRGINENLSPAYLWSNDASLRVVSGSSNVQQGRDFVVSATQPASMVRWELSTDNGSTTYSYTPYPYPHPLQRSSIAPPTGLAVTVN